MFVTLFFLPSFDYPFHFMAPFLAMAKLKQAWLCSSGLTKTFHFMAPFLAMAELKQALFLLIWLNENVCKNVTNKKRPPERLS